MDPNRISSTILRSHHTGRDDAFVIDEAASDIAVLSQLTGANVPSQLINFVFNICKQVLRSPSVKN